MSSVPNSGSNSPTVLMERDQEAVAAVDQKQKKGRAGARTDGTRDNGASRSDHKLHIWTERERRKKMRHMFSSIQALLPQLPAKVDKSTIVDETIKYIKSLEDTLQTLEKRKLMVGMLPRSPINELDSKEASFDDYQPSNAISIPVNMHQAFPFPPSPSRFQTWFSPNVVLTICGNEAHISVCSQKKPGLLPNIFYILQKHKLDVMSAHLSSYQCQCLYMITVHGGKGSNANPESLSVEEIFKLAVCEINWWVWRL